MKLSVVTTLYCSETYVNEFYQRMTKTAEMLTHDYEIVFVNDGSPDTSLERAVILHEEDDRVRVIDLSRNFGHHNAIMAGLSYAKGEYIFLIDVDLEEEPELLSQFWEEFQKDDDTDVVYGVQKKRKGGWLEKWSGILFYYLFNKMSDEVKIEKNFSTIRLMNKRYVHGLLQFQEKELYFGPIFELTGFKQKSVFFRKRDKGASAYSLLKKYHIFINSIMSFSRKPLYFIFYSGIIILFFSFIYVLYLIYRKILFGVSITGWTSLMLSVWLLGGGIVFFIGIASIYISKIFIETKNRPVSIIRKIYGRSEKT